MGKNRKLQKQAPTPITYVTDTMDSGPPPPLELTIRSLQSQLAAEKSVGDAVAGHNYELITRLNVADASIITRELQINTIIESLLQERGDLIARLMRIDQRLEAAGHHMIGLTTFQAFNSEL